MNDTNDVCKMVEFEGRLVSAIRVGKFVVINDSGLPDGLLAESVEFLSRFYPKADGYVLFTNTDAACFYGYASQLGLFLTRPQARLMRAVVPNYTAGHRHCVIYCPAKTSTGRYPHLCVYKKRAGVSSAYSWLDEMGNILSHEMAHLDQYGQWRDSNMPFSKWMKANCRSGSVEVDAEYKCIKYADAYRREFGIDTSKKVGKVLTRGNVRLSSMDRQAMLYRANLGVV